MDVITRARNGCVLLCLGAFTVLVPADAVGAVPACTSTVEARQADEDRAAAYLVARGWEPTRAVAVVGKLAGGGRPQCR